MTDFGPSSDVAPDGNVVQLPFLLNAENVIYELDGGPHKAPGASKLNSSALESGADITGIYDFWLSGTGGSSTQKRIVHVGTTVKQDDADGSFSDIFTGLESGKVPAYSTMNDLVIISSDSTSDVPKSWDGSTAQNLAGSPPNFAFSVVHKGRVWAAGNAAFPSRLYYSAYINPEDWIGLGSGEINVDPDDGDRITGLVSHKGDLWVFKGPKKGSIHRILGAAPTGDDPFAKRPFKQGIGAVNHNSIFNWRDDIGFMWSDGNVYSLASTEAYGDFKQASLSLPINTYLREHLNFGFLNKSYAVDWPDLGVVLFSVPIDSSTVPNQILMMDYRFDPVRWANWPSFSNTCISLALVVDSSSSDRRIVMAGGTDGFIRKYGQATRSIDGSTSINFKVTSPNLSYGIPIMEKNISGGALGFQPKNSSNVTFGWTRDNGAQQTETVNQGGTAVLDSFVLGTDVLGGARFVDRFFELEEGGDFRTISFEVSNNTNNEDVELHSISIIGSTGSWSWEND